MSLSRASCTGAFPGKRFASEYQTPPLKPQLLLILIAPAFSLCHFKAACVRSKYMAEIRFTASVVLALPARPKAPSTSHRKRMSCYTTVRNPGLPAKLPACCLPMPSKMQCLRGFGITCAPGLRCSIHCLERRQPTVSPKP